MNYQIARNTSSKCNVIQKMGPIQPKSHKEMSRIVCWIFFYIYKRFYFGYYGYNEIYFLRAKTNFIVTMVMQLLATDESNPWKYLFTSSLTFPSYLLLFGANEPPGRKNYLAVLLIQVYILNWFQYLLHVLIL